jgi:Tfp pilus assembly protein PilN
MRKNRINLIPNEFQPGLEISQEAIPLVILAAFLLYATTSAMSIQIMTLYKTSKIARLKAENKVQHDKVDALNSKQLSKNAENEKLKSMQAVLNHKGYWADIFKELSILIPQDVWLTNLGSTGDSGGKKLVLQGEAPSQKKVADFFSTLEKSQHFSAAVINYSELDAKTMPELYKFEVVVPFKNISTSGDL